MTIEQTILGTILLEPSTLDVIVGSINQDMFYENKHQLIYQAILDCKKNNIQIDLVTVCSDLRGKKQLDDIGGAIYLSALTDNIGSASHIDSHLKIFIQEYIRRQMFVVFNQALNDLNEGQNDIFDIYGSCTNKLEKLFDVNKYEIKKIGEVIAERIEEIEKHKENELIGITTGHSELDQITSGWQPADFIILAGRPSMGKTAISLMFAKNPVLKNNECGLYFSLEMSASRLADRLVSLETTINSETLRLNKLNQSERMAIYDVVDKYSKAELYIHDESNLSIEQISAISITLDRKLKSKRLNGLGFIMIDYLQLIKHTLNDKKNTNDQIGHISKSCKALAKKLNVPVIALSQLNRAVDSRSGEKRPVLSDLRDSGNLEQDADLVMFLYRPEYYGMLTDSDGNSIENLIELIIAKHRNGQIGSTNIYKNKTWSYLSDKPFYNSEEIPNF